MGSRLDIYNWSPVCLSWGRKSGLQAGYLTAVSIAETRDSWAPVKAFLNQPPVCPLKWK